MLTLNFQHPPLLLGTCKLTADAFVGESEINVHVTGILIMGLAYFSP